MKLIDLDKVLNDYNTNPESSVVYDPYVDGINDERDYWLSLLEDTPVIKSSAMNELCLKLKEKGIPWTEYNHIFIGDPETELWISISQKRNTRETFCEDKGQGCLEYFDTTMRNNKQNPVTITAEEAVKRIMDTFGDEEDVVN